MIRNDTHGCWYMGVSDLRSITPTRKMRHSMLIMRLGRTVYIYLPFNTFMVGDALDEWSGFFQSLEKALVGFPVNQCFECS